MVECGLDIGAPAGHGIFGHGVFGHGVFGHGAANSPARSRSTRRHGGCPRPTRPGLTRARAAPGAGERRYGG
jgi:hypothetical protein